MRNSVNKSHLVEKESSLLFLARLFAIALAFFLLAHYCEAQALILEHKRTHKQKVFGVRDRVRLKPIGMSSFRGKIVKVTDSSIFIQRRAQRTGAIFHQEVPVKNIISIARGKKTIPLILGGGLQLAAITSVYAGDKLTIHQITILLLPYLGL